jgi:hypothetical protein
MVLGLFPKEDKIKAMHAWKIIPMLRRISSNSLPRAFVIDWPWMKISPEVISWRRLTDLSNVDLPAPDQGQSITKARGKELLEMRRNIGMIFQHFNLVKRSSVLRNVLSGRVGYHPTENFPRGNIMETIDWSK